MKKLIRCIVVVSFCLLNLTVIQANNKQDGSEYTLEPSNLIVNSQYDSEVGFLNNMVFSKGESKVGNNLYIINDGGYTSGKAGVYSVDIGVKDNPSFKGTVNLTVVQSKGKIIDIQKQGSSILKLSDEYYEGNELKQDKFTQDYGIEDTTVCIKNQADDIFWQNYTLPIARVQWKGGGEEIDTVSSLRFYLGIDRDNEYRGYSQLYDFYPSECKDTSQYQYYAPEYVGYGLNIFKESDLTDLHKESPGGEISLYYQSRDFYPNLSTLKVKTEDYADTKGLYCRQYTIQTSGKQYDDKSYFDPALNEKIVNARNLAEVEIGFTIPEGFNPQTTELVYAGTDIATPLQTAKRDGQVVYRTSDLYATYALIDTSKYEIIDPGDNQVEVDNQDTLVNVKVDLNNTPLDKILPLTKEEQERVLNGETLKMLLSINGKIEEKIKGNAITSIKKKLSNNQEIGTLFDVSIIKQVGEQKHQVTNLNQIITLTFDIPKELQGKNKYMMYRFHNDEIEVLTDLDDNANTITINTDKFSIYAIVYENETNQIVKTMDTTNISYFMGSLVIGLMIIFLVRKKI